MTNINVQYHDLFGKWRHLQTKHKKVISIALAITANDQQGSFID